ncbi:FAD-dependent oxidoreductase [Actinomadura sp. HBU206391]|uniref:FAD-dependent oxidoreductase n=1 Tax=Actinomadura sp. HBU206391 TaxID=2731692 RepID=UPI00165074B6|nr:FAD-dependent oxidoreductase [Actinomadura sp. HBU206391]MBC6461585.1 FAD-dependent oxidoreductase [Actinomadura sp. HBU206391]
MRFDVIVVGGGMIGLTTAIVLAESGRRVRVWSRDLVENTTSAVAGGLWWPYRIRPESRIGGWSLHSLDVMTGLAERPDETGVRMVDGTHLGLRMSELGAWAAEVPGLRPAASDELPAGFDIGLRARTPLIDMPVHLRYLRDRLTAAGGGIEVRALATLAQADGAAPTVMNCTGLGARELVPDPDVRPVQGQLVLAENPGVDEWFVAADPHSADTVYALPQPYGLILGGTAREDAWGVVPDPATAEAIVKRCARIDPRLADAKILDHRVGLRPSRSSARIEAERLPGGALCVHNYGHGGAGITVSWGCAQDAVRLMESSREAADT